MKVRLIKDCKGPDGDKPAGTEIEHAESFRLCEAGLAEPVDEEAKAAYQRHTAKVRAPDPDFWKTEFLENR